MEKYFKNKAHRHIDYLFIAHIFTNSKHILESFQADTMLQKWDKRIPCFPHTHFEIINTVKNKKMSLKQYYNLIHRPYSTFYPVDVVGFVRSILDHL